MLLIYQGERSSKGTVKLELECGSEKLIQYSIIKA
jgi:hypothetical protein